MKEIIKDLEDYLNLASIDTQRVMFVSDVKHPEWEDNNEVMDIAKSQILESVDLLPEESVLSFIGVHAKIPLVGKRHSIGFLITNRRVMTQTDVSFTNREILPNIEFFTHKQDKAELGTKLWLDFITKNDIVTSEEQLSGMEIAIKDTINIVLARLQELRNLPEEIEQSTDFKGRVLELRLKGIIKSFEEDKKRLQSFSEKFSISDILYGIVDKPFFGGVYGLVLTPNGISSREALEKCKTSTWDQVAEFKAIKGEEDFIFLIGTKKHYIPSYQKEHLSAVITLINEIAEGKVFMH
jgi:hypothetical protein